MSGAPTLEDVQKESAADTIRRLMEEQNNGDGTGSLEGDDGRPAAAVGADGDEDGATTPAGTPGRPADGQRRDELGRFAPSSGDGARGAAEADAARAAADGRPAQPSADGGDGGAGAAGAELDLGPLDPLPEWSLEEQEAFRRLPEAAQSFVLSKTSTPPELNQLLEPRRAMWAQAGLNEAQALGQLLQLSDFANQDMHGFIRYMAEQGRVDPMQIWDFRPIIQRHAETLAQQMLAQQQAGQRPYQRQQAQPQPPPQPQQYRDPRVDQLEQQLQGFNTFLAEQQARQQKAEVVQLQNELQGFMDQKDEKGRVAHPYFNQVRERMAQYYRAGFATDLETAYDMACRADPMVKAKIEAAAKADAQRASAGSQRAKAEAARKAGSSVTGTPGAPAASQPSGDLREDMRRAFAERGVTV